MACRAFTLVLFLVLLFGGCRGDLPSDVPVHPPIDQDYLFDASSVSFAWGHRHVGTFIDGDGHVVRYDHSGEVWRAEDFAHPTAAELADKFSTPTDTVAVVDPRVLRRQFAKFAAAAGAGGQDAP